MGKGSTQFQHLVPTEVPTRVLADWLAIWSKHYELPGGPLRVELRPHTAGSDLLSLSVQSEEFGKVANVVFAHIHERKNGSILSVRDQNTFAEQFRKKRLQTLFHLFLIHRYKIVTVHFVSPTEDNLYQAHRMQEQGLFSSVETEIGAIIVASVDTERVAELLRPDGVALGNLIRKVSPPASASRALPGSVRAARSPDRP